jgi:WD40 repeat protein/serine/threonine protein kinase
MAAENTPEKSIFLSAAEIGSPSERAAFLDKACAGNPALRAAVEALLQAHEKPQGLLDAPLVAPTVDQPSALERPGTVIGPYKLIEVIGEGGMGTVYMGQQIEPVRRLVAVKLVKAGMDTRQVLARFEAERQALALMDHPNIARVLDAGETASGRPYFVMELVKGVPITRYCDEHRLSPRQRLELFIPVCQAIQHAHQKGIIHRDIKPTNVLVVLYDGKPVPKVIDFGLAKATGQQLTERTLVTGFGALVGTLEYMSPEQAELNQIDIDTRSDIYSLGVLLYELLTGTTPLEKKRLKEAAMLEVLRLIREEEPPRPSTRLSDSHNSLPSISAQRQMEPAKLRKLVRGELDWIAMKALEKDRNRRYETANGLAMDLQRYLADEPVAAGPPSAAYRFRKFARRNKGPLTAAALVACALVVGTVVSTWMAIRASDAERLAAKRLAAETQARQAEAEERSKADAARAGAEGALYHSLVNEARALQLAGREGWRARALENLHRAADIDTAERDVAGLRTQAVAALSGFDAERVANVQLAADAWSIDFDADGTRLAVATGSEIVLWNIQKAGLNRERAIPLRGVAEVNHTPGAALPAVRFHPDRKQLAFNTWERAVEFAPLQKGEGALPRITGEGQPRSIAFDRHGRIMAISWIDGHVGIYDAITGKQIHNLPVAGASHTDAMPVALSPDGRLVATVGADHSVEVRDIRSDKSATVLGRHRDRVRSLCFSSSGRALASTSYDRTVKIWNCDGGEPLTLMGHSSHVVGVAFSPDGELVASAAIDGTLRLWDVHTGQSLVTFQTPTIVQCVAISPDGNYLASAGSGVISLFRLHGRTNHRTWIDFFSLVCGLEFHPRQNLLAVACDRTLSIRDVDSGQIVRALRGDNLKPIGRVAISADGALIAAALHSYTNVRPLDHHIRVWNAVTGEVSHLLKGHTGDVLSVAFDPSGRRLATAGVDGTVLIWDLVSSQAVTSWQGPGPATTVRFLGDGDQVLIWHPTGRVELRDARDGKLIRHVDGLEGRPEVDEHSPALAVDPDECQAAVPCRDGAVRFLTLPDLELTSTVPVAHRGPVHCVAFSPDGRWFASAGEDRTVVLRDRLTMRRLLALPPQNSEILVLAFDRQRSRLAVSGVEQLVTLWDLDRIAEELAGVELAGKEMARNEGPTRGSATSVEVIPVAGAPHFQRGNELKANGRLEEAIAEYRQAVELDPRYLMPRWEFAGALHDAGRNDEALDVLSDAIRLAPHIQSFRQKRLEYQIAQKKWREAAADFTELNQRNPDNSYLWFECAVLLLQSGDNEGYRKLCTRMRERFELSQDYGQLAALAHTCALAPGALGDADLVLRLAQRRWTLTPQGSNHRLFSLHALGLAQYRAGQYQEVIASLSEDVPNAKELPSAPNGDNQARNWLILAMAHSRLGHAEEARTWFEKTERWLTAQSRKDAGGVASDIPPGWAWSGWLAVQLLRGEAESLILGKDEK